MESLEPDPSLGLNPGSTTSQVCDLEHIDKSHCASLLPAFKGTNDRNTEPGVKYEVFRTVLGTQLVLVFTAREGPGKKCICYGQTAML